MTSLAWHHPHMKKPTQKCFSMLLMLSNPASTRSLFVVWILNDVLVLAVALVQTLQALASESIQLWVAFGTGEHLRYLAAQEIANTFTNNPALSLPCNSRDAIRCPASMGKARRPPAADSTTAVFIALSRPQTKIAEEWMSALELFVV